MRSATQFVRSFIVVAGLAGLAIYVFIVAMDPYMNLGVVQLDGRAPVSQNQRFAYPSVARNKAFNSVVVGTSTARLLDPLGLEPPDFRFANLAMNSATAYEQTRTLGLFMKHHPQAKAIVLGVDGTWCQGGGEIEKLTFRSFPEWMYDDSQINDFAYMFNDKALENAVRMAQLLLGYRASKYRLDGYRDFTTDFGEWRAEVVHERLYRGRKQPRARHETQPDAEVELARFPLVSELRALVGQLDPDTRVLILLPPLHQVYIARHQKNLSACKAALLAAFGERPNSEIVDYLFSSEITTADENYWDQLHFTRRVAQGIEREIRDRLARPRQTFEYRRVSTLAGKN